MTMEDELYLKHMGIAGKDAAKYLAAVRDKLVAEPGARRSTHLWSLPSEATYEEDAVRISAGNA